MSDTETGYPPVRVHVVADATRGDAPVLMPGPRKRAVTMQTVLITATNPVQPVLAENPRRCEGWIIPSGDGEFLLSRSETQANSNAAQASNAAGTPVGAFIPKTAITAPVPVHTTDPVWASATTTVLGSGTVRVGVIEILED